MLASATSFTLIPPVVLALLGAALLSAGWAWRSASARWLGLSFVLTSSGLVWQITLHPGSGIALPLWFVWGFTVLYVAAAACCAQALSMRWCIPMRWHWAAALGAAILGYQVWFTVVQPHMPARVYGLSLVGIAIFALPLWQWRAMRPANRFDRWLRWMCVALMCIHSMGTVVQIGAASGLSNIDYIHSWFWWGAHVFVLSAAIGVGTLLLLAEVESVMQRLHVERVQDPLTGLLNRRGFDERVQDLLQRRAAPHAAAWALLVVDLDHFKEVNDQWGHGAGDQVLQRVAQCLQQQAASSDVLARFGGEEFVLLTTASSLAGALVRAEQVRTAVACMPLPCLAGQTVTASIGVTVLQTLTQPDLHHAFQAADVQLYQAKALGRNRVVSAPLVPQPMPAAAPPDSRPQAVVHSAPVA